MSQDHATTDRAATRTAEIDRTRRLFEYISGIAKLQMRVVGDLREYEEIVWLGGMPDAAEIQSALRGDPGARGDWLVVKRPRFTPPPIPPAELEPWLSSAAVRDSSKPLTLNQAATVFRDITNAEGETDSRAVVIALEDSPDVVEDFEPYEVEWTRWAAEDRRLKPIHSVYSSLYAIHQRVAVLQEMYEVVLGVGLVTLRRGSTIIRRPLLVAKADVELDPETGRLTVGPAGDGLDLHVEYEMLEADEQPPGDIIRAVQERLVDIDDPLDTEAAGALLKTWTYASGQDARYDESHLEPTSVERGMVVTFAPVVMLRRRTRRAIVDFCRQVLVELDTHSVEIPGAVRDLIERPVDEELPHRDGGENAALPVEAMFPLSANDEQREIVDRLNRSSGLVVEGPPGTGKSHTIANLIAHLTASGQRVLVTSHTARALTVLKGKLPAGIRDLCVDVLGEGRERRDNLERSVTALLARHDDPNWDARRIDERLEQVRARLRDHREHRSGLVAEERRARELEVENHDPSSPDYRGSLSRIAARVVADAAQFDWFDDVADGPAPTVLSRVADLIATERDITPDVVTLAERAGPAPEDLPTPMQVRDAFERMGEAERHVAATPTRSARLISTLDPEDRDGLARAITALEAARREALRSPAPWMGAAVGDVMGPQAGPFTRVGGVIRGSLASLEIDLEVVDRAGVVGVTQENIGRLRAQVDELAAHLGRGGRMRTLTGRPEPVQRSAELLGTIRVAGQVPDTAERLALVSRWIAAQAALDTGERAWWDYLPKYGPSLVARRAALADALADLERLAALSAARTAVEHRIDGVAGLLIPDWNVPASVEQILADVAEAQAIADATVAREVLRVRMAPLQEAAVSSAAAPEVRQALSAVESRDVAGYAAAMTGLRALADARVRIQFRNTLRAEVAAVAPRMASAIIASPSDAAWDERVPLCASAWEWRRTDRWLRKIAGVRPAAEIGRELADYEVRILKLVGEIAENLAWRSALQSLTPDARRSLKAYQESMRRFGKGTGIHAQRHLANARGYLDACQDAVPVWIMPTHLVAETIVPKPGMFDVVIVDEASQSGVDSSFLFWLGKKMVVVGDDRQISPEPVGLDGNAAARLANTYLHDFRYRSVLDVGSSLFTQAEVRFSAHVRLREHFRCMPEIIAFSNALSYSDRPLVPLRQYGSERLDPLVARYVEAGETRGSSGNKVNDREAEQIVTTVSRLVADSAYKNKTMGVISLLGSAQARLISDLLVRSLPAEELSRRQLRCGDAYAFQGDERDVMFLSMVAAPDSEGTRLRTISERTFQQRYNVAASRAKDQEWLFHSVTLDELKPDDLRHRLLSHFVGPTAEEIERELGEIPDDRVVEPFDSVFEQLVYKALRQRGYKVEPQVSVHGYRIDLVVTGRDRKLAIECDGDFWHGPEQYARDAGRQRDLERCGWTFVRIRGSEFFGDRARALAALWAALDDSKILPQGSDEPRRAAPKLDTLIAEPTQVAVARADVVGLAGEADVDYDVRVVHAPVEEPELGAEVDGLSAPLHIEQPSPAAPVEHRALPIGPAAPSSTNWAGDDPVLWDDVGLEGAGEGGSGDGQAVAPYTLWVPSHRPPALGSVVATPERIAAVLEEITRAEGPVVVDTAYARYVKATGGHRVSNATRRSLNQSLAIALRHGSVAAHDPLERPGYANKILRRPGTPTIVVRGRGDRDLEEIPPDEVATVARALAIRSGVQPGEALKRAILDFYDRKRLTERASTYLDLCFGLFGDDSVRAAADAFAERLRAAPASRIPAESSDMSHDSHGMDEKGGISALGAPPSTLPGPSGVEAVLAGDDIDGEEVGSGPPFWEVVLDLVRAADALGDGEKQMLGALWQQVDGDAEMATLRTKAIDLGAERSWPAVARFITSRSSTATPELRGAIVELSYVTFLLAQPGGSRTEVPEWPRRLVDGWRQAVVESQRSGASRQAIVLCIHQQPPGRCSSIVCAHHPLGGIDTTVA